MTFNQLVKYIKDNPNHYWFKRKIYGWGWVPATWQGWLVILGFLVFLALQSILLEYTPQADSDVLLFALNVFFSVIALLLICKVTGERPGWKWGLTQEEKEKYQ